LEEFSAAVALQLREIKRWNMKRFGYITKFLKGPWVEYACVLRGFRATQVYRVGFRVMFHLWEPRRINRLLVSSLQ
jgi:hypothetical protein